MSVPAWAQDSISIFDVRKTLPLEPDEPVYHDYYVNAGSAAGIKKDMFVSVVRRTPIHDPVKNKAQATLSFEIAKVQIIHVEPMMSVARLATQYESNDRPVMEFEAVMIGDALDLKTASMQAPKPVKRRSSQRAARSNPAPLVGDTIPEQVPVVAQPAVEPTDTASTDQASEMVSIPVGAVKLEPEPVNETSEASSSKSQESGLQKLAPQKPKIESTSPSAAVPGMVPSADEPTQI